MLHLSIRARLMFLSASLLVILAISSLLLSRELARDSEALDEEVRLVSIVRNVNAASKHFGDLRYWLTDFAETRLSRSRQNAAAAKGGLDSDLRNFAAVDPAGVAAIGQEVDRLNELAQKAADAYSSDDTEAGRALMAQAKQHILTVDEEIEKIVGRVEQQALARRDASVGQAKLAVNGSIAGGIFALILALGLTALIVHSIVVPLRRVEEGMTAITRGKLDAPIPEATSDEFGGMARALRMLRDSLIERDRLEGEIRAARDTAEAALQELKAAQANLIHAEKMASLGQLTAGIAHEIKNPLNFVNNFASLSAEMLDELKAISAPAVAALDAEKRAQFDEMVQLLTGNLEKIIGHGKRADGIVRSMLLHSSGGSGEWEKTDINDLVDQALNLAYHGARAQDQNFNVTLEQEFDSAVVPIEVVRQDVTRVFLNLFGNGFYAATKKAHASDAAPVLKVTTRELGNAVEIQVRDNGVGIPPENRDKLFQPFFTTKPTGEGTGLGLSISYDIITQLHLGTIEVDSRVGEFTEFTIRLPRRGRGASITKTARVSDSHRQ
jgi:signal transduction histidine kinase